MGVIGIADDDKSKGKEKRVIGLADDKSKGKDERVIGLSRPATGPPGRAAGKAASRQHEEPSLPTAAWQHEGRDGHVAEVRRR